MKKMHLLVFSLLCLGFAYAQQANVEPVEASYDDPVWIKEYRPCAQNRDRQHVVCIKGGREACLPTYCEID